MDWTPCQWLAFWFIVGLAIGLLCGYVYGRISGYDFGHAKGYDEGKRKGDDDGWWRGKNYEHNRTDNDLNRLRERAAQVAEMSEQLQRENRHWCMKAGDVIRELPLRL